MKKLLSALLAIILIISIPVTVFAQEEEQSVHAFSLIKENYNTGAVFLDVNDSTQLVVSVESTDEAARYINWESSAPDVISVNEDGVITALAAGHAKIIARAAEDSEISVEYDVYGIVRHGGNYLSTAGMNVVSTKKAKYTYSQMEKDLAALSNKYPEIMSYSSVGTTWDNRNVYEAVVGNPQATKHILIQACMHAREYMNAMLVMRQIESICANYCTGSYQGVAYCELLDNTCIHFIPMLNPDGVSISQFGADGIRDKKLKADIIKMCKKYGGSSTNYYTRWKANGRGVDLNRNFPVAWSSSFKNIKTPRSALYKGPSAASEVESKIIMSRVNEINPEAVISYHSTGSIIYWNFTQRGKLQADSKSLFKLANSLTGYHDAEPYLSKKKTPTKEPTFGGWVCDYKRIPTLTIETGINQCPLKIKEFDDIWKKHRFFPQAIAYWAICHDEAEIKSISAKKKAFNITLSMPKAEGEYCQLQYSTSSKFSKPRTIVISDNSVTSKKISNLKANKKYYVRIRVCRKINGIEYYSKWSSVRAIKTK